MVSKRSRERASDGTSKSGRRRFLRTAGAAVVALGGVGTVGASKRGRVRSLRPDTAGFDTLDEVRVEVYDRGRVHVGMGGHVPADTSPRSYAVELRDVRSNREKFTPARAHVSAGSTFDDALLIDTQSDDVYTTESDEGATAELQFEGGCWVRSEDPVDLPVCRSDQWMTWGSSEEEAVYLERHGRWKTWDYELGSDFSDWELDDDEFERVDWSRTDADSRWVTDYVNWTFQDDDKPTYAYHQCTVSGNVDGSFEWWTDAWHEGEASDNLHARSGHHDTYE